MNEFWNLDPIYKGFDDPAYAADMNLLKEKAAQITAFASTLSTCSPLDGDRKSVV